MYYFLGIIMFLLFVLANLRVGKEENLFKKRTLTIEKVVYIFIFLTYFAIFALEDIQSNGDMIIYENTYNSYSNMDWQRFLITVVDTKNPLYHIKAYLFSALGLSFYGWHAVIGFIYSFALFSLIRKYSSNIYISIIVSIALGSLGFALSALRQVLALSFIILSFRFIEERKFIKFTLLVLFASLFHITAIVFLIAYFLYRIKLSIKNILILSGIMIAIIPFTRTIVERILPLLDVNELYYEYLESDTLLSISGVIISAFILIFCVICILLGKQDAKRQGLCNFAVVSLFFRILSTFFVAEMFRFSLYFSVFDVILIAEACSCGKENNKFIRIKTLSTSLVLMIYYFISPTVNITNYMFR